MKTYGPFLFPNHGPRADDLHVRFTGSGGSLKNPKVVFPPGGHKARAKANEVDVDFDPPIPTFGMVFLVVDSLFPIRVESYYWTRKGKKLREPGEAPRTRKTKPKTPRRRGEGRKA